MDWTPIIVGAIAALAPTMVGIATLIQGIRTHKTFNSKMDAMLELVRKAAYAKGRKDEKDERE